MNEPRARGRIAWRCDTCGRAIADGDGYLHVGYAAMRAREAAVAEWERAYPNHTVSPDDPGAYPSRVAWEVHHASCDPEPNGYDYWIAVERIRTGPDVIAWSAHLLEKNWLGQTTWRELLRRTHRLLTAA